MSFKHGGGHDGDGVALVLEDEPLEESVDGVKIFTILGEDDDGNDGRTHKVPSCGDDALPASHHHHPLSGDLQKLSPHVAQHQQAKLDVGHPSCTKREDCSRTAPSSIPSLDLTQNDITRRSSSVAGGDDDKRTIVHDGDENNRGIWCAQRATDALGDEIHDFTDQLDSLIQLARENPSGGEIDPIPDPQFHFSFLDVPEDQQDDGISVLTSKTFFTSASVISEADYSEFGVSDSLLHDDLLSVLTPRTANYSCHASKKSHRANESQGKDSNEPIAVKETHLRGILRSRSPTRRDSRRESPRDRTGTFVSEDVEHSAEKADLIWSNTAPAQCEQKKAGTCDQPTNNGKGGNHVRTSSKNSVSFEGIAECFNIANAHIMPVLSAPLLVESSNLHRPDPQPGSASLPSSRRYEVQDIEEGSLHTALAEPLVASMDCSSTLATNERSLLIKQGRCPSCGIQTHKLSSRMFRKRRLRPLSNEHILSGRCLVCNPIDVVTSDMSWADAPHAFEEGETNDEPLGETPHKSDIKIASSPRKDQQDKNLKKEPFGNHLHSQAGGEASIVDNPPPSAPPSEMCVGSCSKAEDDELSTHNHHDRRKYFSKQDSEGEVEMWLLSHLPTLQKEDLEKYCRYLAEDGFDSMIMMEVLDEQEDLHFMKKAHRRLLCRKLSVL